ncbi:CTLH/CRA C-terminal to lish motif domain-containing protein [Crepidotus variabilis]|uniref:CTLH/CRA C-terminal to lish motif domain-containing protein n=1 Tax=Crepidotus variabilis TaxID=179855 RepID=A0A9P6EUG4_9AGAR|nr:CTLH/CRA C-terminal to lish motif domain-containing protein [Crepidotus variabilis]
MSSSSSRISFSNLTPDQLRSIVLDYLCHGCYTNTAAAFHRDSNPVKQLDADGDEIVSGSGVNGASGSSTATESDKMLEEIKLRQEIRVQILSGRVDDAVELLNKHFPAVLAETLPIREDGNSTTEDESVNPAGGHAATESRPSMSNLEYLSSTSTEPAHLLLNLRILAFCEACRTIPLPYPPDASSAATVTENGDVDDIDIDSDEEDSDVQQQQMALLIKAQKLYAYTKTLVNAADKATYVKEMENVGGLLAYKTPEKSSMAKYLSMERREAVADQINRAVLKRTGRPLISSLELITRYTTVLWGAANELGIKPRPGVVIPSKASSDMDTDNEIQAVPSFSLPRFVGSDLRP